MTPEEATDLIDNIIILRCLELKQSSPVLLNALKTNKEQLTEYLRATDPRLTHEPPNNPPTKG